MRTPRFVRRRRLKRLLAVALCLVLFGAGVWTAVRLASPRPPGMRVVGSPRSRPPLFRHDPDRNSVVVQQEVAPGKQQEFEIQGTDEGILIRPTTPP